MYMKHPCCGILKGKRTYGIKIEYVVMNFIIVCNRKGVMLNGDRVSEYVTGISVRVFRRRYSVEIIW